MDLNRLGLGVLVVTLAIALCLAVAPVASSAADVTVGCGGASDEPTIQDAVNEAEPGERIEVCDGVYNENVTVPETKDGIQIAVRDGHDAVLDGSGISDENGFTVLADDVRIEGFVVTDFSGDAAAGDGYAISIHEASGTTVTETVLESSSGGVHVRTTGDTIDGVTVDRVAIQDTGFPLTVEAEGAGAEIHDVQVHEVVVDNNTNRSFVKARDGGHVEGLTVERTAVVDSGETGLAFGAEDGGTMTDVVVTRSLFANNSDDGLALRTDGAGELTDVTVTEVASENNVQYGINLDLRSDFQDVTIQDNLVRDNDFKGIFSRADENLARDELDLSYNVIEGNAAYGAYQAVDGVFDARLNYWGASDGPSTHSDADEPPVSDPIYPWVVADGSGDAVGEDPDESGVSNVNFAPAIGAKDTCDDPQLIDLVADGNHEVTVEGHAVEVDVRDRSFDYQVDDATVGGPLTDFVGACAWERLPFPLRTTADSAATSVPTGDNIFVEVGGEVVDANRPNLNVHQEGERVDFTYGPVTHADTRRFARRDAQLVVARVAHENVDAVDLEDVFEASVDARRGDASFDTDLVEFVHVQDTTIDADGRPTDDLAFTPDEDGVYVAALAVLRTGGGFTLEKDGSMSTNIHETDLTVAGAEIVAVQQTESDARPRPGAVEQGEDVEFSLDANFAPDGDVSHALVLYHDQQFQDTSVIARFDGEVDLEDLVLSDGEMVLDLSHHHASDRITVSADGPFDTLASDVTVSGEFTVINATGTMVERGDAEETVTLTVGEDFETGEYRYVHVAVDDAGTFSTTTDTMRVRHETPVTEPPPDPAKAPRVRKRGPNRVTVEVPGSISRNFCAGLPGTDAMTESGISVDQVCARSNILTTVDMDLLTSRGPPAKVPTLDTKRRTGHLYLDVSYDVAPENWVNSSFTWRASTDRFGDRDPEDLQLYRYDGAGDWEAIDTEFVAETDDAYVFRSDADGFSVYAFGTQESGLEVTDASLSADRIQAGDPVDVRATVENRGDGTGTLTAELRVDGEVVQTQDVTLGPGESQDIRFVETFDEPGTYEVAVNDVSAGTLEVIEEAVGTSTPTRTPEVAAPSWLGTVLLILLIMVLVSAGIYVYRRR